MPNGSPPATAPSAPPATTAASARPPRPRCTNSTTAARLIASGKFGGGGYKVSGGLHGVGVSVVNALATRLVVEVRNRDHLWRQSFNLGVPDGELEQVRPMEPGEETGTTVTY